MQLIIHQKITDYAKWRTAFDADHESRTQAGLSTLQIWMDDDSTEHVFFLLEVNDKSKAQAWITRSDALHSDDGNTVLNSSAYFVNTK